MAETHVISALTTKRAELAGLIEYHHKETSRLSEEVKTLDLTIKLFDPDYRIYSIKPKRYQRKNEFFKHGEAHKLMLDILREAASPISTIAIADEAKSRKGLELNPTQLSAFKASIGGTLSRQKKLGLIVETGKDKGVSVWVIA
jgi:hypothetical protein